MKYYDQPLDCRIEYYFFFLLTLFFPLKSAMTIHIKCSSKPIPPHEISNCHPSQFKNDYLEIFKVKVIIFNYAVCMDEYEYSANSYQIHF